MEAEFDVYEKNRQWHKIYQNLNSTTKRSRNTKEAHKEENRRLNRYTDVVPYDETLVRLDSTRTGIYYINASHVEDVAADRKYILTQGPLEHTTSHFWQMIWEQKSKAILMLNNLMEAGHVKCHKYWPDLNGPNGGEFMFKDTNFCVRYVTEDKHDFYVLRKFTLTDLMSQQSREVLQFHYTHWPDFDLPKTSDSFLDFLFAVRESGSLDISRNGPAVIHCSAGIGRSGTFVLVDSCLVLIEKNNCLDSINIIDRLLDLRKYRMGLIQTHEQLRFSYLAIIEGSKRVLKPATTTINNNNNNNNETAKAVTTTKPKLTIKRSLGVNESEDATEEEIEINQATLTPLDRSDEGELDFQAKNGQLPSSPTEANNNPSLLLREERNRKTRETVEKMKRKQKETEERCASKKGRLTR